ncbi:MAG TPA: ATP-binding protein [Candidatus Limnocylindria bacterium]|nr:ATP-binding protein [Candidatus Limnocylindria bacterium]
MIARPSGRRAGAVEVALTALLVALTVFTALVVAVPSVHPALVNDRLDLAITTSAAIIGLSVAGLAWLRFRESGELRSLLQAAAFGLLGTLNAGTMAVGIAGVEHRFGGTLAAPGQLPILLGLVTRFAVAVLLVWACLARPGPVRLAGWTARALVGGPSIGLVLAAVWLAVGDVRLPALVEPDALAALAVDPTLPLGADAGFLHLGAEMLTALAYVAAAWLSFRDWLAGRGIGAAWLAAGLIIAAFSQLHAGIHPGAHASLVTTADFLRVGFYLALLLGIAAERREDVRALRRANVQLVRLGEAEATRAALEERARLAREIHDGLAQDLWYAKLKQTRLEQAGPLTAEQALLAHEVIDAIDAALAEARQAVMAMRLAGDAPLDVLLERYVEDFADRFGIRAGVHRDGELPTLSTRTQAEVLRIVQEALNNVRKHADATAVRVALVAEAASLRVTIVDNGRGFDPRTEVGSGFGMESMRQRAALIGAEIDVDARPQDGTRLALTIPLSQPEAST